MGVAALGTAGPLGMDAIAHDSNELIRIQARAPDQGAVNIGTEETISIADLATAICRLADRSPALHYDTTKPEGRFVKSADMGLFRTLVPG